MATAKATFGEGTYVFVPDEEQCFIPAKVNATFTQGAQGSVSIVGSKQQYTTVSPAQSEKCVPMDAQSLESIDNMVDLKALNDASILNNLRLRFFENNIYTAIGTILVSINPFKLLPIYTPEIQDQYIKLTSKRLPPHIFGVADLAFRNMADSGKDQACIVSGESGAGKTEATKLFLSYLAEISARRAAAVREKLDGSRAASPNPAQASEDNASLQDRLLEANPLMEAFGNAKTSRNDNSSRFGKWIAVRFDPLLGAVSGGSITDYLLEKSRIVKVNEGERNYHIFYQLCAGCSTNPALRDTLKVTDPSSFNYLNQSSAQTVPTINDEREWSHTLQAFGVIGISDKVILIQRALAGILHLGNVVFKGDEKSEVTNKSVLQFAASLFEVDASALEKGLICRNVSTARDTVFKDNTATQAADTRDAFAKQVYGMMFTWLIAKINTALGSANFAGTSSTDKKNARIIGVLDIFGFESFQVNSFEQLCINYCNEKLQGHFNQHIFMLEQDEYKAEGVDVSKIEFFDNSVVLDVLERKVKGVFSLIDEEITVPRGTDDTLLKKILDLDQTPKDAVVLKRPNVKDVRTNAKLANVFIITHYAGEVGYDITGFLYKDKDELPLDLENLLASSKSELIRDLFTVAKNENAPATAGKSGKKTLGSKFKDQLTALMTTLNATEPHFVRCVKPNMEKQGGKFHAPMALDQLRYSGLLEVCRIRQLGYPMRRTFKEFIFRYYPIVAGSGVARELKPLTAALVSKKYLTGSDWQIGNSKVFMRTNNFNMLEIAREDALKKNVAKTQKIARGFIARRKAKRNKLLIKALEAALKTNTEDALEDAILEAGALPYRGAHLKVMQKAHDALERIRAVDRAAKVVEEALKTNDIDAINSAIKNAEKAGAGEHATVKKARAYVEDLKKELEARTKLKDAMAKNDIKSLQEAVAFAAKMKLSNITEAREAEAVLDRLVAIEKIVSDLKAAVTKKDEDKIRLLMGKMAELGAKDHPVVAEAEKTTKIIGEMSARHARRIADIKARMTDAATERDFVALGNLEIEAQKLGIQNEPTVLAAIKVRAEIELERHVNAQLETAIATVENKSDNPDGIKKEDIMILTEAINAAKKEGAKKDSETLEHAMDVEARVKKQLQVQVDLDEALRTLDEKKLKDAFDAATELGLQIDSARRAQQELHRMDQKRQTVAPSAAPARRNSVRKSITAAMSATASAAAAVVKSAGKVAGVRKADAPESKTTELLIASDKDLEKNYADRIAKASAASKVFQGRLFRAVGPHFHFARYLRIRQDEDFTELEPSRKKKAKAKRKLKHQKDVITKSVLLLKDSLNDDAIKIFDALLGWCGDKPAQFQPSLAQFILKKGLLEPRLVDEIFIQLIKQLSDNKKPESEDRAWLLMCLAVQTFPPSKEFEAFLLNFFVQYRTDAGMIGNYARFCIFNVGATEKIGPSKFQPQTQDIELYLKRPPVMLKVHQIFRTVDHRMTWTEVPVWPSHDIAWVCRLVAESSKVPQKVADYCGLFVKDIEGFWGAVGQENANNPAKPADGSTAAPEAQSTGKKLLGFASVSIGAAMTLLNNASAMVKSIATVGRDPPEAIAPWPLPGSVFPGDVYRRMAQQGRVPVFTYQRKLIVEAECTAPDKALFLQVLMAVVSGQLPVSNEAEIVELAALALASRGGTFPDSPAALVMGGLFTYIPVSWCENKSETFWTNAVSSYVRVAGASIPKMDEAKIYARYIAICKRSPLFGAALFSIVRREDEGNDYQCAINANGVHVVATDSFKIVGTIPFAGIEKFGASATYVWYSVSPATVAATPSLFPNDKFGNENTGIVFLHSSQAAEIYHMTYEWAYYQAHKTPKAANLY